MMRKVDILMATYNGSKYIKSQLGSIMAQSYCEWRLLVHDDGSTDETVQIVESFAKRDERIVLIKDGIKTGGAAQNFIYLTQFSEADFVMFADQDDIWFDNKIETMVRIFEDKKHDIPQVLYSNSYVWKPEEGILGLTTCTFPTTIRELLFLNSGVQGCVAMFNRKMNDVLKSWDQPLVMHDQILHLAGVMIGNVSFLHIPLMLYRRAGQNLTGDIIIDKNDLKRIMCNKRSPVVHREHYEVVLNFYEKYHNQVSKQTIRLIDYYRKMVVGNIVERIGWVMKCDFVLFDSKFRLIVKILCRPYIDYLQKW